MKIFNSPLVIALGRSLAVNVGSFCLSMRFHRNPISHSEFHKSVIQGVGINDLNYESKTIAYKAWHNMITRVYSQRALKRNPNYIGCSVCPEWHYLSNFKRWFEDPSNGYQDGYVVDKDIIVKGNKVYSPYTCCLVPPELNSVISNQVNARNGYPLGVYKFRNTYKATFTKVGHLGMFPTPEAAFLAYKKAKENYVKELAEKYYAEGKITERVYIALCNYRVEITD